MVRIGVQTVTKELIETMEKQIGKIEKAVSRYIIAKGAHELTFSFASAQVRAALHRELLTAQREYQSILSTVTDELGAAKAALDAEDEQNAERERRREHLNEIRSRLTPNPHPQQLERRRR